MGFAENMPDGGCSVTLIFPHKNIGNFVLMSENTGQKIKSKQKQKTFCIFYSYRLDKTPFTCALYILCLITFKNDIKNYKTYESYLIQK